jgi:S-DNA-T family DNA segregation ATPase FtsK/SpoIIIE
LARPTWRSVWFTDRLIPQSMLEKRSHKQDVVALALLALAVFLAISLLSYNPADPPSSLVYPQHSKIANACGRSGAVAADWLLEAIGLGAYFLIFSLAILDAALLSRRNVSDPWFRATGWMLAMLGITTLLSMGFHGATPGPVIGPGGYLGAAGRTLLEMHFARAGALILAISLTLAGLLLSTDYWLFRVGFWSAWVPFLAVRHVSRQVRGISPEVAAKSKAKLKSADVGKSADVDKEEDSDAPAEPAVRIRGKRVDETEEAAEETDEAEDEDSEEEADEKADEVASAISGEQADAAAEPETPKSGIAARLASALRIRNLPGMKDREAVIEQLEAASRAEEPVQYELPPIDLLLPNEAVSLEEHEQEVRQKAKILEKTFASFGFKVKVVEIETGPVIAQYEIELEAGLRLAKITNLADDLAIALRVPSVRIVAPIPGKNTVGIEVPNNERQLVRMREVIEEADGKARKMRIPIYLGKDVSGNPLLVDLATLPHLLIAGRTGTGKSVCLNSIIVSMLMSRGPDDVRMLMIDPKMVELSSYKRLPHLMHPVVTDMRKAEAILAWAVEKMEERYALLARAGVRQIGVYNQLGEEELLERLQPETEEERAQIPLHLPYIVIVADEIADLMMTAGKEVEQHIIRLAQKSRAVGIHLVLATQKPTVDVITGLIKSNLPARIAFQVASRTDSRVVLDEMGADRLLGNGDMLFLSPNMGTLMRGQGAYLTDEEINKVVDFVSTTEPQFVKELVQLKATDHGDNTAEKLKSRDEFYEAAVDIVIREGRGSVSLLQRALGIGYGRAARLVDFMAEDGIVGTYNGSQAREVLITMDQWSQMIGQEAAPEPEPPRPKRNRILPEARAKAPVEEDDAEEEDEEIDERVDDEEEESNESDEESDEDTDDEESNDDESDDDGDDDGDEELSDDDESDEEDADESEDDEAEDSAAGDEEADTDEQSHRIDTADEPNSARAPTAELESEANEPTLRMHSGLRRNRSSLLRPRD